jgi:hypothetical protein
MRDWPFGISLASSVGLTVARAAMVSRPGGAGTCSCRMIVHTFDSSEPDIRRAAVRLPCRVAEHRTVSGRG